MKHPARPSLRPDLDPQSPTRLALLALLALAGCGGGGGDGADAGDIQPNQQAGQWDDLRWEQGLWS